MIELSQNFNKGILDKNIIENGGMRWSQRQTSRPSFSLLPGGLIYLADRMGLYRQNSGTWNGVYQYTQENVEGDVGLPVNLTKAARLQVNTAETTVLANEGLQTFYSVHGPDLALFYKYPFTFSLYVKSNAPGSYPITFASQNGLTAYSSRLTIDAADTWERKQFFIPEIPSSGYGAFNFGVSYVGLSVAIHWDANLSAVANLNEWTTDGSVNIGTSNFSSSIGNYFEITGMQLVAGHRVLPWVNRYADEAEELTAMRRYFEKSLAVNRYINLSTNLAPPANVDDYLPAAFPIAGGSTRLDVSSVQFRVPKWRFGRQWIWNHRGNLQENFISVYNGDTNQSVTKNDDNCNADHLGSYLEAGVALSDSAYRCQFYADCELVIATAK